LYGIIGAANTNVRFFTFTLAPPRQNIDYDLLQQIGHTFSGNIRKNTCQIRTGAPAPKIFVNPKGRAKIKARIVPRGTLKNANQNYNL
jgi:hypothetical protein